MNTASLTMGGDCTLVARPHPFDSDTSFARVPAGQTLSQMLGPDASHSLQVAIGGYDVPNALWGVTRPKAGQTIHVTNYPQGGNAGKWVRLVLTVVLMYFTFGASGWAASASTAFGGSAAMWGAEIILVGWSPALNRMEAVRWVRWPQDKGFTASPVGKALMLPDAEWEQKPDAPDTAEKMEAIARDQVAYVRRKHPGYNCGDRLLLAELTRDTLSVRTVADLEAPPVDAAQEGAHR